MIDILRLTPTYAAQYRALMLQTCADAPGAYIATVAEREHLPMEFWEARVSAEADAGTEPFAFKAGEEFVADVHMWCDVGGSAL